MFITASPVTALLTSTDTLTLVFPEISMVPEVHTPCALVPVLVTLNSLLQTENVPVVLCTDQPVIPLSTVVPFVCGKSSSHTVPVAPVLEKTSMDFDPVHPVAGSVTVNT